MSIKCYKCGSEWNSNQCVIKCPFCGIDLTLKNDEKIENVSDCLRFLIENYGIEILSDKKRLISFSCDLIPQKQDDLRLLRTVVQSGVFLPFIEVDPSDYALEIKKAIDILVNSFFLSKEFSVKAMTWLADALNVVYRDDEFLMSQIAQDPIKTVLSFEQHGKPEQKKKNQSNEIKQMVDICDTHLIYIKADKSIATKSFDSYSYRDAKKILEHFAAEDVVQVSAGDDFSVALLETGKVVAAGNNSSGQCNVSNWTNIVQVSTGRNVTLGLNSDGCVVSTIDYSGYRNHWAKEIETWESIKQVCVGVDGIAGIKKDNSIVFVNDGMISHPDFLSLSKIIKIDYYKELVAISQDGRLFIEKNRKIHEYCSDFYIDVSVGYNFVIALKRNHKVSLFGDEINSKLEKEINDRGEVVQVRANGQKLICKFKDGLFIFGSIYDNHLFYER